MVKMYHRILAIAPLALLAASKPVSLSSGRDGDAEVWARLQSRAVGATVQETVSRRADTTWNPPSNLVTPLQQVWDHEMSTYDNPLGFKNYGFDQIMANKGCASLVTRSLPSYLTPPVPWQLHQLLRSLGLLRNRYGGTARAD